MQDGTVLVGKTPKITPDFTRVSVKRGIRSIIDKRMPFDDMLRLAISYDHENQSSNIETNQKYAASLLSWEMQENGTQYDGYTCNAPLKRRGNA
jgi:hypothetical protein